ncbi:hypothetical protein K402DRAFT_401361 [Aulographum hederae CBS 113979]|uniref:Uncharacterized protein n=1 Tax=Aulographum hederae CBS 113979 TaxID=1176131 RepID=A0A6G1HBE5_9PEZI|nr:hypothetical protein K402DRAFT_401361 [Aulographum hederae CBS 113979]
MHPMSSLPNETPPWPYWSKTPPEIKLHILSFLLYDDEPLSLHAILDPATAPSVSPTEKQLVSYLEVEPHIFGREGAKIMMSINSFKISVVAKWEGLSDETLRILLQKNGPRDFALAPGSSPHSAALSKAYQTSLLCAALHYRSIPRVHHLKLSSLRQMVFDLRGLDWLSYWVRTPLASITKWYFFDCYAAFYAITATALDLKAQCDACIIGLDAMLEGVDYQGLVSDNREKFCHCIVFAKECALDMTRYASDGRKFREAER